MQDYNLGFITNDAIYEHVKGFVSQYRTAINLSSFNSNIIDPIKLTFDAKVYGRTFEEIIEAECIRQIDKTNSNTIGYFHQHLFKYAGNGWEVPSAGFDVLNRKLHIYAEVKNKHNTMNSSSAQSSYMKMQDMLLSDDRAVCMLVEVIAKKSQNINWKTTLKGHQYNHDRIRRVSIDKFYEIVYGDAKAFSRLCRALPLILDDVVEELHCGKIQNSVYSELNEISPDTFKSLYLLAFKSYEGFNEF